MLRRYLIDTPDGLTASFPKGLGEAHVIEELLCSQKLFCHERRWHVVESGDVRELWPEQNESHFANLTFREQVRWIIPLVLKAQGTAAWDRHEVVHTRVEGQTVADGQQEEVANLVVHLLGEREVLNTNSCDRSQFVQLFKECA